MFTHAPISGSRRTAGYIRRPNCRSFPASNTGTSHYLKSSIRTARSTDRIIRTSYNSTFGEAPVERSRFVGRVRHSFSASVYRAASIECSRSVGRTRPLLSDLAFRGVPVEHSRSVEHTRLSPPPSRSQRKSRPSVLSPLGVPDLHPATFSAASRGRSHFDLPERNRSKSCPKMSRRSNDACDYGNKKK